MFLKKIDLAFDLAFDSVTTFKVLSSVINFAIQHVFYLHVY